MGVFDFPETVEDTDSMVSLVMFQVIQSMGWQKQIGHYIYYKLELKKPKKNTLSLITSNNFKKSHKISK